MLRWILIALLPCPFYREWFGWHFPELVKIVNDNYIYAKLADYIKDKSELAEKDISKLADLIGDEDKAKEVVEAAKASMGNEIWLHLTSVVI